MIAMQMYSENRRAAVYALVNEKTSTSMPRVAYLLPTTCSVFDGVCPFKVDLATYRFAKSGCLSRESTIVLKIFVELLGVDALLQLAVLRGVDLSLGIHPVRWFRFHFRA